jgi:hypothetical protein
MTQEVGVTGEKILVTRNGKPETKTALQYFHALRALV